MTKYYNVEGTIVSMKDDVISPLRRDYVSMNNMLIIPEDGTIEGSEVQEGDLIITFYSNEYVILKKDEQLAKFLTNKIKKQYEEKLSSRIDDMCDCNQGKNEII